MAHTCHKYANFNYNLLVPRHPTSCASIAEIMSTLFFHTMRYKVSAPKDASSDRFVLSKGHAAPILYAGNYSRVLLFISADHVVFVDSLGRGWSFPGRRPAEAAQD